MAPKVQRKTQRYNREKQQNLPVKSTSTGLPPQDAQNIDKLWEFAEEFIQGGRRSQEEIAIHEKMKQDGIQIKYLDLDEASNVNPLKIHLRRAEELRFFRNHPSLGVDEVDPLPTGSSDRDLGQPRSHTSTTTQDTVLPDTPSERGITGSDTASDDLTMRGNTNHEST